MRYLLVCLLAATGCGASEESIRSEIAQANTCERAEDCANVGTYCPYGCNILVNKSQASRIRALLEANNKNTCQYDCIALASIACENKICVAKLQ